MPRPIKIHRRRKRIEPAPPVGKRLGATYDQAGNVVPDPPVVTAPADIADVTVTVPPTGPNLFAIAAIIALAWWLWDNMQELEA
jgi:hypothetical protein